ncbi:ATP-binding protein [Candidatus Parcubacteria bacterium]|nr:ATP-binding protein [Candidatus Parcubacteria bacterium]
MAIKNILDNAIKYTPDYGTIHIGLGLDEKRGFVEVFISDSGVGLSKEQKKKLFTQLYRGHSAAKTNPGGSGMGLFITKQIMEANQGDVRAESKGENHGSTFYIDFPIHKRVAK